MKVNSSEDISNYFHSKQEQLVYADFLEFVGNKGRYQWRVFLIFAISMLTQGSVAMGQAFLFINPPLLCDGQPCADIPNYCDQNYVLTVDTQNFANKNVVTQFELYCNKKILGTVAESSYFVGSVIGLTLFSFLSDQKGRRLAIILSTLLGLIGTLGLTLSVSIYMYIASNFITGFGFSIYILAFVVLNEICEKKFRQIASIGVLLSWSFTEIIVSGSYLFLTSWRLILLIFTLIPAALTFLGSFFIHETPQYKLSQKKYDEFYLQLDAIAKSNNCKIISPHVENFKERIDPDYLEPEVDQYTKKLLKKHRVYTIADLFKYKSLRYSSIGFIFISFTLHLIYYGGEFSISEISEGNTTYYLGMLMGLAEGIGYLLVSMFVPKLKRRKSIIFSFIFSLAFIACFFFFGFSADATKKVDCEFCFKKIMILMIAAAIRISICFGFGIQGLYANEVYPTVVRSLGTGFLFAVGIMGSFMAPYIIELGTLIDLNPYFLIGGICITGPFACLKMVETLNRPLPDTIEEVKVKETTMIQGSMSQAEQDQKDLLENPSYPN